MTTAKRVQDGGNWMGNESLNGPLRAQSKVFPSILRREDRRYLPGVCWYPAKRTVVP